MKINKPPMGWNSWNTFAENIDEQLILDSADALIEKGLLDAGYNYVVIDDCWALRERGKDGKIVPDPKKFPNGMRSLADKLHAKGLKFGMYSCSGLMTCAQYPSSLDREWIDAQSFAEWGVDFLKYDYCYRPANRKGEESYRAMGLALANSGRDILFSACSWGADKTHEWIRTTGADRLRGGGQLFGLPGQEAPCPVGAPHHRPHQQQNAQNAVHGLHIRQHAPQRRVGVGHGIVKLQQTDRSVLQF